jgi:hypothetical protein
MIESQRRLMILEYVREHSVDSDGKQIKKITKSDVMRHLKEVRPMTTHKTTVELIKEGKIKMVKDKPYSQTDYLVLNENNEFNRIWKILTQFDYFITKFDKNMDKIRTTLETFQKDQEHVEFVAAQALGLSVMNWYAHIFDNLLRNTLIRISRSRLSEKDRQFLTNVVVDLMNKLNTTNRLYYTTHSVGPTLREDIDMMKRYYKMSEESKHYSEKYGIDLKVIEELDSIIAKSSELDII